MLALYGHLFSSYTWKALIPLYANGTEFEFRELGPETFTERGVRVVIDGKNCLSKSRFASADLTYRGIGR